MHRAIARRAQSLDELEYKLLRFGRRSVSDPAKRWKELDHRFQMTDMRLRFRAYRHALELMLQRMAKAMQGGMWRTNSRLSAAEGHLRQLSPLTVLSRGYAIVQDESGRALRSAEETGAGEKLIIRLHEGLVTAAVTGTTKI